MGAGREPCTQEGTMHPGKKKKGENFEGMSERYQLYYLVGLPDLSGCEPINTTFFIFSKD